jgi:hypothetical protein
MTQRHCTVLRRFEGTQNLSFSQPQQPIRDDLGDNADQLTVTRLYVGALPRSGVLRGVVWGGFNPPPARISEVLTKSNRIAN